MFSGFASGYGSGVEYSIFHIRAGGKSFGVVMDMNVSNNGSH